MQQRWWITVALIVLTIVVFGQVFQCEFVHWDDPLYITANSDVLNGLNGNTVGWAFTESCYRAGYWVPVLWMSLQIDASLFGPAGAWGFHLTNLLIHAGNAALFFLALQQMTGDRWRSAVAAALFALHPLRVESVAWVTERKDVLSTLFLLLTLLAYYHYVQRASLGRYLVVLGCFLLGLMSKPTLVTLPFALLLLDYWPLYRLRLGQEIPARFASQSPGNWAWLIVEKIPFLVLSAVTSLLTLFFASDMGAVATVERVPWGQRLIIMLSGYLGYLKNTLWPTNLALLYPSEGWWFWGAVFAFLVLALITVMSLLLRRKYPFLIVGWLWFVGTLLPVSGIVQVGPQAFADRHSYVPHLGLWIAIVWGVSSLRLWSSLSASSQRTLAIIPLAAFAVLAWIQTWYWHNSESIFLHTLSVTQKNYLIEAALAEYYGQQGDLEKGDKHYENACNIVSDPNIERAYATMLIRYGVYEKALDRLQRALQSEPANPDSHYLHALADSKLGKWTDARQHLDQAFKSWREQTPSAAFTLANQAGAHQLYGSVLLRDGQLKPAIAEFQLSLRILPREVLSHEWLGIAMGRLAQWQEAEHQFRVALELDPESTSSRGYLAYALSRQRKTEAAAQEYARLLHASADWLKETNEHAAKMVSVSASRDPATAEELALQICEATGFRQPVYLDTLAAVHAAKAEYAKAREIIAAAIALTSDPDLKSHLQKKQGRYARGATH